MGERAPDLIGAALLVVLGAAFAAGALLYGYEIFGQGGRIGPGFMPFFIGILLAVFGAMVGVGAWLRGRSAGSVDEEAGIPAGLPADGGEDGSNRTVAVVFGLTLVAILLTSVIGFLFSFGLLVFVLVKFVEGRSLLVGVATGVGSTVLAWLIFGLLLNIPLPGGMFVPGG